jgi:hypothetical protein
MPSQLSTYFKRRMAFRKTGKSLVCSEKLYSFFKPVVLCSETSKTPESYIN